MFLPLTPRAPGRFPPDVLAQTDYPESPSAVRGLTARDTDQNTIVLNWMAPSDDGGSDIAKYRIVVADNDSASDNPGALPVDAAAAAAVDIGVGAIVTKDATTTHTHEELTAGIRYRYQVYAINEADLMSQNAGDTAAETTETLDKPGAPTGLTAVQTNTREYMLYWYVPAQTGGTDISAYKVEVALQGGSFAVPPDADLDPDNTNSNTAQATYRVPNDVDHDDNGATDNIPVTMVRFRVYSQTSDATKTPAVTLTSNSPDTSRTLTLLADMVIDPTTRESVALRTKRIPGRPTFVADDAKRDGFGNVDLDWNAPATGTDTTPSTVSGYRIDVSDDEGISWRPLPNAKNTRKTDTEYTYKDPEKKNRHYRIFAWNGQYLGPAQMVPVESEPEAADLGEPDHATGLTVTAVGPSQINVSWTAPENTGGSPIMHYEVHGSLMGSSGFAALPTLAPETQVRGMLFTTRESTSYSHTGLSAGQTWRYRVVPVNENENMNMAAAVNAEVRQATTHQEEMPEAPEMLVAESAKSSNSDASEELGVLLLWNAPNAPDGADIGGYRIQRMKDGGAWETLASNTNAPNTDFTDSEEPAMGEMRGYQVAAISANNILGAYSNVAMIPQDTSHTPVVGPEVGPATGVTTGPFNAGGTIQVSWDAAPNATGYIIYAVNVDELDDPDGQIVVAPVNDAAAETFNLGGLKSGDTYDIYVVATAKEMVAWPASTGVQQVTAN